MQNEHQLHDNAEDVAPQAPAIAAGQMATAIARETSIANTNPTYIVETAKATAIGTVAALTAMGIGTPR